MIFVHQFDREIFFCLNDTLQFDRPRIYSYFTSFINCHFFFGCNSPIKHQCLIWFAFQFLVLSFMFIFSNFLMVYFKIAEKHIWFVNSNNYLTKVGKYIWFEIFRNCFITFYSSWLFNKMRQFYNNLLSSNIYI